MAMANGSVEHAIRNRKCSNCNSLIPKGNKCYTIRPAFHDRVNFCKECIANINKELQEVD